MPSPNVIVPEPVTDLSVMSSTELRTILAQGLVLVAGSLTRLAMAWAELERRGDDLSEFRKGFNYFLPLIASGRLAAEACVAFAGQRNLLRALEGVPIDRQRALAAGETVAVIDPSDVRTVQQMPLRLMPAAAYRLVFAEGEIRPPEAQRLALRPKKTNAEPAKVRLFRPHFSPATGEITVGKMTVRLADLLTELAASAGPDKPPVIDPDDPPDSYSVVRVRLTREEYQRLQSMCGRVGLPDWEMSRKALRAFGLI